MLQSPDLDTGTKRRLAAAIVILLAWSTLSGTLLKPLFAFDWITQIPYARSLIITVIDIVLLSSAIALIAKRWSHAGLVGLPNHMLMWALAVFVPVIIIAALASPFNAQVTLSQWLWLVLASPISEEVFYRGLALATLVMWCSWPRWLAYLVPAAMFGLAHAGQGNGWQDALGIAAITGAGSYFFGWTMLRWQSLWPAIILHVGMNGLWNAFALGENAIGGWLGNGLRLWILAAAILLTLRWAPKLASTGKP